MKFGFRGPAEDFVASFNSTVNFYQNEIAKAQSSIKEFMAKKADIEFKLKIALNNLTYIAEQEALRMRSIYGPDSTQFQFMNDLRGHFYNAYQNKDPMQAMSYEYWINAIKNNNSYRAIWDDADFWKEYAKSLATIGPVLMTARKTWLDRDRIYYEDGSANNRLATLKGELQGWLAQAAQYRDLVSSIPSYEEIIAGSLMQSVVHPIAIQTQQLVTQAARPTSAVLTSSMEQIPMVALPSNSSVVAPTSEIPGEPMVAVPANVVQMSAPMNKTLLYGGVAAVAALLLLRR